MSVHQVVIAADVCVFRRVNDELELLLIQRKKSPFEGFWALPGGRLEENETIDECCLRELYEETGLKPDWIRHFANFSEPLRDPRIRTVSAAYVASLNVHSTEAVAGSDAAEVCWFSVESLPELAFDHASIVVVAVKAMII